MVNILISYRRSDSLAIAGRMFDRLVQKYGPQNVFMDIDAIPLGIDFRDYINSALLNTNVVLAVMGRNWVGKAEDGKRRIDEANDLVRVETETALSRGIPVIPVLVENATMPKLAELPPSLASLSYRNAALVDAGLDFHSHMDRLIRAVDRLGTPANSQMREDTRDKSSDGVDALVQEVRRLAEESAKREPRPVAAADDQVRESHAVVSEPADIFAKPTKRIPARPRVTRTKLTHGQAIEITQGDSPKSEFRPAAPSRMVRTIIGVISVTLISFVILALYRQVFAAHRILFFAIMLSTTLFTLLSRFVVGIQIGFWRVGIVLVLFATSIVLVEWGEFDAWTVISLCLAASLTIAGMLTHVKYSAKGRPVLFWATLGISIFLAAVVVRISSVEQARSTLQVIDAAMLSGFFLANLAFLGAALTRRDLPW